MNSQVACETIDNAPRGGPSRVLWWDGRVDNRKDLRWLAGALPHDASDAALVLAAYTRRGVHGLAEVTGDWGVVIRDGRTGQIVLASDFAGVRPLYYHWRPGRVFWSSRLQPLVEATGLDTIDEQYVAGFLLFGGCPARTPYTGIASVPPGHAVRVSATGVSTEAFWTPPTDDVICYRDERAYDEQLRVLFREAVATRLQTDAPVLAQLSGGLDSSSVVCMATELVRANAVAAPAVTTVSFDHRDALDSRFMGEVEAFCGIDGVHLSTQQYPVVREGGVGNALPAGWIPVHQAVAALAHRIGARVLLTGHNGDLVNGNWLDDSLQVAGWLRRLRLGRMCREAFTWSEALGVPIAHILLRSVRAAFPSPGAADVYAAAGVPGSPQAAREETSLRPAFVERTGAAEPLNWFTRDWMQARTERRMHFLALTVARELRSLQVPEPLQDLDYTHPFAHRPLVEFLMRVPPDVLCRPREPRRLMRRALAGLWPAGLRTRRSKSLFHGPWLEALRPLVPQLLRAARWHVVDRGWVDRASLETRLHRFTQGLTCNDAQLRLILILEFWLRERITNGRGDAALQVA